LTNALQVIAFGLGGEAGSRLAAQLQMPTSADTLLRLIRSWCPPKPPTPKKVGVDDWALRKRINYGTIVVDLETRQPIELLEDRTSAVLKGWLLKQENIEVIARDRSSEYALGAKEGAPKAVQVADRFHLLQNLKQMLDRLLTNLYAQLQPLLKENNQTETPVTARLLTSIRDVSAHEKTSSAASRERRLETYEQIKRLKSAGWKIGQIARRLNINPTTVRKYFYAEVFPERTRRPAGGSILNPYLAYMEERFREGCHNGLQLWREIKQRGYRGTNRQVSKWMSKRRQQEEATRINIVSEMIEKTATPAAPPPPVDVMPSPRQLSWIMMRPEPQLKEEETRVLSDISRHTQVKQVYGLAQQFIEMVNQRQADKLDQWLKDCKATGIAMLQSFATRIDQDYAAVRAALETQWSNGQTEGQINRLKLLKRQMYGRANFDLLRQRVLYPT
jgi:transposase